MRGQKSKEKRRKQRSTGNVRGAERGEENSECEGGGKRELEEAQVK